MNNIVTLRLSTPDIALLERLGKKEKKDRSTTLRDLVTKGRLYVAKDLSNVDKVFRYWPLM